MRSIVPLLAILSICSSCTLNRDNVHVTDAATGQPIAGASVTPIYPSFGGPTYDTDKHGVAHIGGLGLPRDGYGVEVSAHGYEKAFVATYPTAENHAGWNADNMDVSLQSAVRR